MGGLGWGFAVGYRLSYVPALRCAPRRASYEPSLALVVAARWTMPYVRSAPRALAPAPSVPHRLPSLHRLRTPPELHPRVARRHRAAGAPAVVGEGELQAEGGDGEAGEVEPGAD
jgi:hypothetical protein